MPVSFARSVTWVTVLPSPAGSADGSWASQGAFPAGAGGQALFGGPGRSGRGWRARRRGGGAGPGGVGVDTRLEAPTEPFEHVLADEVAGRQLDRVLAVGAGPAQPGLGLLGG